MTTQRISLVVFLLILLMTPEVYSQDTAKIESQIRQRAEQFVTFFNSHEAEQLAAIYAVDSDVLHDDRPMLGRAEMLKGFQKYFTENPNVTTEIKDLKVNVVSPTVAIESGTWHDSNHSKAGLDMQGTYTAVYELLDGKWQIIVERAWPKKDEPLTSLPIDKIPVIGDYLRGQWTISGTTRGQQVSGSMTVTASSDGRAQHYNWTIESDGQTKRGSAIGGVDPATGCVVEHGFSSDGDSWINRYEGAPLVNLDSASGTRIGNVGGKPFKGSIAVNRTSQDRFTYEIKSDGETAVDFVFERVHGAVEKTGAAQALIDHLRGGTWRMVEPTQGTEDSYQAILGGRFTRFYSMGNSDLPNTVGILGIHPDTGHLTWWTFRSDGSVGIEPTTIDRQGSSRFHAMIGGADHLTNLDIDFKITNANKSVLSTIGNVNGTELPKDTVWERVLDADQTWVNADPPSDIPQAMSGLKNITGLKWLTMKSPENGVGSGSSYGRWILGGKFFMYTANAVFENGDDWGHCFIMGREPDTGKYTGWEFGADGAVGQFLSSNDGMSLEGSLVGESLTTEPGQQLTYRGSFKLEGDVWRYTASIGPKGGPAVPYEWTWRDVVAE